MAASNFDTLFQSAVSKILRSWTVLELAINHGLGGIHSEEKGVWMSSAICQWFLENEGIEPYELEDFLEDVLNVEFDTIAQDGSLPQISQMICNMFELYNSGQEDEVINRLKLLPSPQIRQCVAGSDETQEDKNPVQVSCNGTGDRLSGDIINTDASGADNSHSAEAMETEEAGPSNEENDGWTVVKKGKKR